MQGFPGSNSRPPQPKLPGASSDFDRIMEDYNALEDVEEIEDPR